MKAKIKIYAIMCILTFCVFSFAICSVDATSRTFIISPMQEVVEIKELNLPGRVCGNIFAQNGTIDFYVTNPSKNVILCYNQIENADFNFTRSEKGDYTMHLVNSVSPTDTTVQLSYSVDYRFEILENVSFRAESSVGTASVVGPAPAPFDWTPIIQRIVEAIISGLVTVFASKIRDFIEWLKWIWKYRKSRTPVVLVPRAS